MAYDVEDRGDEARISVNPRTDFGRGVYDEISSDESLRTVVDLMLMSMGYSEFVDCKQLAENIELWHQARREISTNLNEFSRKIAGDDA